MLQKVQVNSDVLYKYLTDHGVKLVRLAELMGISDGSLTSCFKHQIINKGVPRTFTDKNIIRLNDALEQVAEQLRGCVLTFGSDQVFTNQRGKTYDPALVEPMKLIGKWLNLTALVERVLGWNKDKKEKTLVTPSSKIYGTITKDDVDRINAELLSVAGVLGNYEVVSDEHGVTNCAAGINQFAEPQNNNKSFAQRKSVSFAAEHNPWDDTSLSLQERTRLVRERFQNGVLLFRVNGGYTVEGEDALHVQELNSSIYPYTDQTTGLTTVYMDEDTIKKVLPLLLLENRNVFFTNMYKE